MHVYVLTYVLVLKRYCRCRSARVRPYYPDLQTQLHSHLPGSCCGTHRPHRCLVVPLTMAAVTTDPTPISPLHLTAVVAVAAAAAVEVGVTEVMDPLALRLLEGVAVVAVAALLVAAAALVVAVVAAAASVAAAVPAVMLVVPGPASVVAVNSKCYARRRNSHLR